MQIDLSALPDDGATLQLILRAVVLQQGELAAENDKLRLLILRLTRHQFGRRSEQLTPDQLPGALATPAMAARVPSSLPPRPTGPSTAARRQRR